MEKLHEVVWGVIGAGRVCEKKSMPALDRVPHSRVKTVMRRNADACRDFAERHGIPNWTTDSREIFNDPEINAVYIATPPDTHASYTLNAAHAGKAVYVEKPMARNAHECRTMIAACNEAEVPLFVAFYRRELPHFKRIKALIDEGKIGLVEQVRILFNRSPRPEDIKRLPANWRIHPEISGGGHFHDLGSHQLDLLDFFFGPVVHVKAKVENRGGLYEPADFIHAELEFSSGVHGIGDWDFTASQPDVKDEITILGDKGMIKFSTFEHARIEGVSADAGLISEEMDLPDHIQEPLIRTMIAELRGEGTCPSTGATAIRTSALLDIICKKN